MAAAGRPPRASATRERAGFDSGQSWASEAADCASARPPACSIATAPCTASASTLSQTLWSFQAFSQLKEANFRRPRPRPPRSAQQNLLLRVAQAYFAILSAADQLATNRGERDAFAHAARIRPGRASRPASVRAATSSRRRRSTMRPSKASSTRRTRWTMRTALTEIVGAHVAESRRCATDIPLVSPEPASADEWVSRRARTISTCAPPSSRWRPPSATSPRSGAGPADLLADRRQLQDSPRTKCSAAIRRLDTVGVSFSWPLFQGGAVASAVRQSRALYRQAQAAYDPAQRDTERQTRAAFRGMVSGISASAPRGARSNRAAAVEASRRNVEFGTGTEFELLECAEQLLRRAARLQPDALRLSDQRADPQAAGRPPDRAGSHRRRRAAHRERAHDACGLLTQGTRHACATPPARIA